MTKELTKFSKGSVNKDKDNMDKKILEKAKSLGKSQGEIKKPPNTRSNGDNL